ATGGVRDRHSCARAERPPRLAPSIAAIRQVFPPGKFHRRKTGMTIPNELTERVFARNQKERESLKQKHLVVVGAGSVGSALALMAVRAGVGRFTLIDVD